MNEQEIMLQAINLYGMELQLIVAIEEMSELIQALTKYLRGDNSAACLLSIVDEAADVGIVLNELVLIFGIEDDVDAARNTKLLRLMNRIAADMRREVSPDDAVQARNGT